MSEELMVSKSLDSNTYTLAGGSGASYINPILWVKQIEQFAKANLVLAPLGKVYNDLVGKPGGTLNIQFNSEISAAALTETTAITPSSFSYTQVQFTPSEVGIAVALTRKEDIRSIQDIMMEKTADMGYALAKFKDAKIASTLVSGTGNSVVVNSVAVSAVTTSDTINTSTIADALKELRIDEYNGKYLVIHPKQENALIKLSQFIDASVYGGRETVLNGEIGKYLGIKVLVTTQIPRNSTTSTAYDCLLLDQDAFGIAYKMPTVFNADYKVLERQYVLAAVEEYDVKVLRANKICTITAYGG